MRDFGYVNKTGKYRQIVVVPELHSHLQTLSKEFGIPSYKLASALLSYALTQLNSVELLWDACESYLRKEALQPRDTRKIE
jgi:hypothetical protein